MRLISCSTGSIPHGGVAQDVADTLNVDVMAPDSLHWAHWDGNESIGPTDAGGGSWVPFRPQGQAP